MAKLEEDFQFTGRIGNLSSYKMRGVDGIVVRKKGGPSKEQFETSPKLQRTRRTPRNLASVQRVAAPFTGYYPR